MSDPTAQRRRPGDTQVSTRTLAQRSQRGDSGAAERLFSRLIGRVQQWAHGRLPAAMRDVEDTVDLVQGAAAGAWQHLGDLDLSRPDALEAYVRETVRNRIRDEARRFSRHGQAQELDSQLPSDSPSPLEQVMTRQGWTRYQHALARLEPEYQEAIVARLELGYRYEEIATLLKKPSANAARSLVVRATQRLDVELKRQEDEGNRGPA